MSRTPRPRLLLDSNVLMGGFIAQWGLDKSVLSLCAARICRLVLADAVRIEVERNLAFHAKRLDLNDADGPIMAYRRFLRLCNPEIVPLPPLDQLLAQRGLIRHAPDLPVLLSAMSAAPDWLLTNNTAHFTQAVARRSGLRIATPVEFFQAIASLMR